MIDRDTGAMLAFSADAINAKHTEAIGSARNAVECAWECGKMLSAVKAQLEHGEFLPWVAQNCDFTERHARRYMKLFAGNANRTRVADLSLRQALEALKPKEAAGTQDRDYDTDQWSTPAPVIESARSVLGGIDLDPATNPSAQKTIKAKTHYTKDDDGLDKPWAGRMWLNPPYSQPAIGRFLAKAIDGFDNGEISEAIILVNNATETAWFQSLLERFTVCFPRGRVAFRHPDRPNEAGARQGQALFYLGYEEGKFLDEFGKYGICLQRTG